MSSPDNVSSMESIVARIQTCWCCGFAKVVARVGEICVRPARIVVGQLRFRNSVCISLQERYRSVCDPIHVMLARTQFNPESVGRVMLGCAILITPFKDPSSALSRLRERLLNRTSSIPSSTQTLIDVVDAFRSPLSRSCVPFLLADRTR